RLPLYGYWNNGSLLVEFVSDKEPPGMAAFPDAPEQTTYLLLGMERSTWRAVSRVRSMSALVCAALTWLRLMAVGSMKIPCSHMVRRNHTSAWVSFLSRSV